MFATHLRLKAIVTAVLMAVMLTFIAIVASPGSMARPLPESPLAAPSRSRPLSESPLAVPSPLPALNPTISPALPDAERAVQFVAQRQGTLWESLNLVDTFTIELPLTGVTLWRGLVLDTQGKSHPLHEVVIHEGTKEILANSGVNPSVYWESEEQAFREEHGQRIRKLAARRAGVPAGDLEIANGFVQQHPRDRRWVWQGKVMDTARGDIHRVAIDARGREVDVQNLERAADEARCARYGKLDAQLFYLLPFLEPGEKAEVLLWVDGVDYAGVDAELVRRYPGIGAERFTGGVPVTGQGQPVAVEPELFDRIRADYDDLLDQAHRRAAEPVVAFLEARGYEAEVVDVFPGVVAKLPPDAIRELGHAELDNLSTVYYAESEVTPQLDSVHETVRVEPVWNSGYTGQGVRLGTMDKGIVGPPVTHPAFWGKTLIYRPGDPSSRHAAQVAGVLFGDDYRAPYLRGIAYGSTELVTVGREEFDPDDIDILVDNNAHVINLSMSTHATREMQWTDRVLDYVVRYRDPTIVVAAGELDDEPRYVKSPAKAYNVITVGAFDDHDDGDWSNDSVWAPSCYVDPYNDVADPQSYQTHRKPDVVAVGVDVITVDDAQGSGYVRVRGTSIAAPQVTGLAALLVQRYWWLRVNPETVKAIIMASAIHNIEGSTRLSDKDGAGGIVASEAMAVFDRGGWAHHIIYDINNPADPTNPFDGPGTSYDFRGSDTGIWDVGSTNAYAGERVRAVLCWDSNPTGDLHSVGSDALSTDLDLRAVAPNGTVVDWSVSSYNSCEIVDFIAPQTGEYRMRVKWYGGTGESLNLGLGLAWLRVPMQHVYLPAVMKNY